MALVTKTSHWSDTFNKIIRDNTGHSQLAYGNPRVIRNGLTRSCEQVIANISDMLHENLQGVQCRQLLV